MSCLPNFLLTVLAPFSHIGRTKGGGRRGEENKRNQVPESPLRMLFLVTYIIHVCLYVAIILKKSVI